MPGCITNGRTYPQEYKSMHLINIVHCCAQCNRVDQFLVLMSAVSNCANFSMGWKNTMILSLYLKQSQVHFLAKKIIIIILENHMTLGIDVFPDKVGACPQNCLPLCR